MKKITHRMEGFKKSQIYDAFKTLFDTYLLNRDYEKTLSYVDDDFYSVGTGKEEVVVDKNTYANLYERQKWRILTTVNVIFVNSSPKSPKMPIPMSDSQSMVN